MWLTLAPVADPPSPNRHCVTPASGAAHARAVALNLAAVPTCALLGIVTLVSTGPFGLKSALSVMFARFQTATARLAVSIATRALELDGEETRTGGCHAPPAGRIDARIAPLELLAHTATALPAGFIATRAPLSETFVASGACADQLPVPDLPAPRSDVPSSHTRSEERRVGKECRSRGRRDHAEVARV